MYNKKCHIVCKKMLAKLGHNIPFLSEKYNLPFSHGYWVVFNGDVTYSLYEPKASVRPLKMHSQYITEQKRYHYQGQFLLNIFTFTPVEVCVNILCLGEASPSTVNVDSFCPPFTPLMSMFMSMSNTLPL